MFRWLAALPALCGLAAASHAQKVDPARVGALAEEQNFSGVILISRGDTIVYARALGGVRPGSGEAHQLVQRWRWASITKQLVATVAMQQVAAGRLVLDAPISRYWPDFPNTASETITIRLPTPPTPTITDGCKMIAKGCENGQLGKLVFNGRK